MNRTSAALGLTILILAVFLQVSLNIKQTAAHLENHKVEILYGPLTLDSGVKLLHARDNNGLELGFVELVSQ